VLEQVLQPPFTTFAVLDLRLGAAERDQDRDRHQLAHVEVEARLGSGVWSGWITPGAT
jgi:hypothetical protein